MFRKTFIRFTILVFLATAGLLVAASIEYRNSGCDGNCSSEQATPEKTSSGDLFMLESVHQAVLISKR